MKRKISLILIFLVVAGVYGCIPYKFQKTPEIKGYVFNAETKQPIKDATVYFNQYSEEKTTTDSTGFFKILPHFEWGYIILGPFDAIPPNGDLVIEADGFLYTKLLGLYSTKPMEKNIELQKKE